MSATGRATAPSRIATFLSVVGIFAAIGRLVGTVVVLTISFVTQFFSRGFDNLGNALGNFAFLLLVGPIFGYMVGVGHAVIAGMLVATVGIFMRWNNILSPLFAGAIVSFFGHHTWRLYLSAGSAKAGDGALWAKGGIVLVPICVAASLVCWYLTRGIVRRTWQSV